MEIDTPFCISNSKFYCSKFFELCTRTRDSMVVKHILSLQ
jgi:hypothetical protein